MHRRAPHSRSGGSEAPAWPGTQTVCKGFYLTVFRGAKLESPEDPHKQGHKGTKGSTRFRVEWQVEAVSARG